MRSAARNRTILGVLLFLPLAAVLLVTFACLPAPVGDPEQSKVDPALNGAWSAQKDDDKLLVLVRPWDARTYFIQYMENKKKDGKDENQGLHFKAWLTTLGGQSFIVCEPIDRFDFVPGFLDQNDKPFWIVGRVEVGTDSMTFRMVNSDSPLMKDLSTREQLEAAITANVDKNELYSDAITFKKLGKDDAAAIHDSLKAFNVGM